MRKAILGAASALALASPAVAADLPVTPYSDVPNYERHTYGYRITPPAVVEEPAPVERELAVDGIQEFFDLIPIRPGSDVRGNGESIHLHCTDGDGEWLARLEPDGLRVTREHAKGDVAARGSASDLLLLIWGRERPAVDVFGEPAVLAQFLERARF